VANIGFTQDYNFDFDVSNLQIYKDDADFIYGK
jgi:hypothetical protein